MSDPTLPAVFKCAGCPAVVSSVVVVSGQPGVCIDCYLRGRAPTINGPLKPPPSLPTHGELCFKISELEAQRNEDRRLAGRMLDRKNGEIRRLRTLLIDLETDLDGLAKLWRQAGANSVAEELETLAERVRAGRQGP